jgi:hypothetical protein
MPEGENETWGKKEVIFNCSPSPASPYDLLVWCHNSLQPYTQGPSHFFLRRRSQELTQEIFTPEEALAFTPFWCPLHFAQWNKLSMHLHDISTWPQQFPPPCSSARASHFPHIIKTRGKQLALTTVKSTVEVHSISHITLISTVWERMANTDSCILLHSTTATITANEWWIYTVVHTIILLWISENIMYEPTNRQSAVTYDYLYHSGGTPWGSWLRHCATNRKVRDSIPDGVIGNFYWHNPTGHTLTLGSTQSPREMSTRNISLWVKAAGAYGWQPHHLHVLNVMKSGCSTSWNPQGLSRPVPPLPSQ